MNVVERIGEIIQGVSVEHGIPAFAGMTSERADFIECVYEASRGKNLFTNSFLSCASKGQLFFKFRELLSALMHSDVNEIINNTKLVLNMGETSGADQLTGFLIGMKRYLK
jgi:hypothetical protein